MPSISTRPRVQKDPKDLEKILEGMRTGLVLTLLAGLWVKSAQKLGDFEQKVSYENELSNCLKADKFDYGSILVDQVGDFGQFGQVYYHPRALANILCFHDLVSKYHVSYDSSKVDAFVVTTPKRVVTFKSKGNLAECFSSQLQCNSLQRLTTCVEDGLRSIQQGCLSTCLFLSLFLPCCMQREVVGRCVSCNCNLHQGDVMTIQPLLVHIKAMIQSKFPDEWFFVKFYVDDGNFIAPSKIMREIIKILQNSYGTFGYKLKSALMHYPDLQGSILVDQVGDFGQFGQVYYHPRALANILCFHDLVSKYHVSYDSSKVDAFVVTTPKRVVTFKSKGNLAECFSSQLQCNSLQRLTTCVEDGLRSIQQGCLSTCLFLSLFLPCCMQREVVGRCVSCNCNLHQGDVMTIQPLLVHIKAMIQSKFPDEWFFVKFY
eukprot:gene14584-16159_t